MVIRVGLEPTTPSLRGSCSNQLSYRTKPTKGQCYQKQHYHIIPQNVIIYHMHRKSDYILRIALILGDAIALVAAETQALADQAVKLVEVEYEELPFIDSP